MVRGRRTNRLASLLSLGLVAGALGAWASPSAARTSTVQDAASSSVTYAQLPGNLLNYVFPLTSDEYDTVPNINQFQFMIYPPLYWYGSPGGVGLNEPLSAADPPQLSVSGGKSVATVHLKSWRWSDGHPITARDVEFDFDLLRADKTAWWAYIPTEFPDNVSSFRVLGPSEFAVTFNADYSPEWVSTELAQLFAIPQHAWDKTSQSGAVGNYDLTTAGAQAVYKFLNAQSTDIATYATNPLWKVVDGAWLISAYTPLTTALTLTRNPDYSGPAPGSVRSVQVLQFTSDAAEFNSLLSGNLDFGYVPFTDFAEIPRIEALGYKVAPWNAFGVSFIPLNFANPITGPIFKQLYVRQALQHLIDEQGWEKAFLGGYGTPTYGPVPGFPSSSYVDAQESTDPDPYNPATAKSLLESHGWKVVPNGTDTCTRPGDGPTDCGAGIRDGAHLAFKMLYPTGLLYAEYEMRDLQAVAAQVGVSISLQQESFSVLFSNFVSCAKPSCWQSLNWVTGWIYSNNLDLPVGDSLFYSTGGSNGMSYDNATADRLIDAVHSGGLAAFHTYENYLSQQVAVLWVPNAPYELVAVRSNLKGALPLDPDLNIYPQDWTLTAG